MANPNLLHPTIIYGKTAVQLVYTTATAIVSNLEAVYSYEEIS